MGWCLLNRQPSVQRALVISNKQLAKENSPRDQHNYILTTLTPQIKGNHRVTNYMFPSVPGQHHGVARECGICCLSTYDIAQESSIPFL